VSRVSALDQALVGGQVSRARAIECASVPPYLPVHLLAQMDLSTRCGHLVIRDLRTGAIDEALVVRS
jgi:hypothetical protein